MSIRSEGVKAWRKRTKRRIVEAMGGKCQICGYDKCDTALSLHHINPEEKEISFGSIRANPRSWPRIVDELRKCVLLCNNCHSEIHEGLVVLPDNIDMFDDSYIDYNIVRFIDYNLCPICGDKKPKVNKFCSKECSSKSRFKIDWDSIDLFNLIKDYTITDIAEVLNVSDSAVHKRLKRLGLK
jgi:hypothetical protein